MNFFKNLFGPDSIEPLDVNCKITCSCNCPGNSFDASADGGKDAVSTGSQLNGKKTT